jgi:ribosomal protein S27AE
MNRRQCPLCASQVWLADQRPYSRATCGKCHANLHVGKDGSLLIGDPPDVDKLYQEWKRDARQRAAQIPLRKVFTGLAVLLILGLAWNLLFGPAERLDRVAEKAAQALASGDPDALTSLAAPGTEDDVRRWYDTVHPQLVRLREQWRGKAEAVEIHVAQEDREQHKGAVGVSIHPVFSGARDTSLADPANATASVSTAFEGGIDWTLTRWGRWKLDGRATAAKVLPTIGAR